MHRNWYEGWAIVPSLTLWLAACGARTEGNLRTFESAGGDVSPDFGGDTSTGGAKTGGSSTFASGGRVASGGRGFGARGAGGRASSSGGAGGIVFASGGAGGIVFASGGAGGIALGSGGSTTASGGQFGRTPESERLLAFVCWDPCKVREDCPSAEPFVGGCNGITHSCLITCENGCPEGTQPLSVSGGCFCYDPRVHTIPANNGTCCSSYCGPPYYLACCNGYSCMPGGQCCLGSSCL